MFIDALSIALCVPLNDLCELKTQFATMQDMISWWRVTEARFLASFELAFKAAKCQVRSACHENPLSNRGAHLTLNIFATSI